MTPKSIKKETLGHPGATYRKGRLILRSKGDFIAKRSPQWDPKTIPNRIIASARPLRMPLGGDLENTCKSNTKNCTNTTSSDPKYRALAAARLKITLLGHTPKKSPKVVLNDPPLDTFWALWAPRATKKLPKTDSKNLS